MSQAQALAYVHPDDRERITTALSRTSERKPWFEHIHRIVSGDGTQRTVQIIGHKDAAHPGFYLGTLQDITAQRRAEAAVRHSEHQLRTIFDAAPIGVALVEAHQPWKLVRANDALAEMLDLEPAELVGRALQSMIDQPHREVAQAHIARLLDGAQHSEGVELQIRDIGGEPTWIVLTGAVIDNQNDRPRQLVLQLVDITQRKQYEQQLRIYAERDTLTGLLNRRRFDEELGRAVAACSRYRTPTTLLVCDLDNLKLINDTLGHHAGDELIKAVATELLQRARQTDLVARMGGDEFTMLLTHTGLEQAKAMAESLRAAVLELDLHADGQRLHTTLSIGLAPLGNGQSAKDSMIAADAAMYEAKRQGRNRIAIGRQTRSESATRQQLGCLERLRSALAEDRFELHAQPITHLRSGEVRHLELLVRMREPDGALLMPAAFIPTAERLRLIAEIDQWVVRNAIEIQAADQHLASTYAINLSGISVGDPELLNLIEHKISEASADPSRLIFEFTETAAIKDLNAARTFTRRLAQIGCASALDDFGCGFASFSYLKQLPVQYIKIDGQFIRNLPGSEDDQVLVKAIIDVAHGLHKQTVAEFVSSNDALELLRAYGVDYAQGFHLATPKPVSHLTRH